MSRTERDRLYRGLPSYQIGYRAGWRVARRSAHTRLLRTGFVLGVIAATIVWGLVVGVLWEVL